jgi:hypothetical protein
MPVEVRELVIKATVTEGGKSGSSATGQNEGQTTASEELIKTCVDKVLQILKEKNDR